MTHLLHLDSSAREAHPGGTVTYRDLVAAPLPHLTEPLVAAMFVPPLLRTPEQVGATALQEAPIDELMAADTVLIGAPMYNFGVPSALKAWIDHVVVFGRTVGQDLFAGARVVVASARGGAYGPGTPREAFDYQERYLRDVLGLVGLTDIVFIHAEMRAAAEGDPGLEQFLQFAADSLAVARAMLRAEAARSLAVTAP